MSAFDVNDSIAAIASPPGPGLRGVIRLSGPHIDRALSRCFDGGDKSLDAQTRSVVLDGIIRVAPPIQRVAADLYFWPGAASYTRQRSAEIQCTGCEPVLSEVMRTLAECGVRQAQPGEFTLRAFLAGRIDLTRAEAVLGVIDSQSDQEMEVALRQLAGGLSGPIEDLHDQLLEVLAHLEAGLDFVEDDIEFISRAAIQSAIDKASETIHGLVQQIDRRQLNRQRPQVVLLGRPNVGKSCLQNALAESASAIVSEVAGTTRDYLVSSTCFDGVEVDLIDTAGTMPESMLDVSYVQERAQEQTDQVVANADMKLICIDGSIEPDPREQLQIDESRKAGSRSIIVRTKSDLPGVWDSDGAVGVSSHTGSGLDELRSRIGGQLKSVQGMHVGEFVNTTANRCFESLHNADRELALADSYLQSGQGDEIIAAALRIVLDELAVVTGKVFTDDILDRVFSRFCIGK